MESSKTINHIEDSFNRAKEEKSKLNDEVLDIKGLTSKKVKHFLNNICNIKCEHVKPLHKEVNKLKNKFKTISFEHIYRKKNIFADSLANQALQEFKNSNV